MDAMQMKKALATLATALRCEFHDEAEEDNVPLRGVEVVEHPQHISVISPSADYTIWVSPWGPPLMYTVQGVKFDATCAAVEHVVELLRKLTAVTP